MVLCFKGLDEIDIGISKQSGEKRISKLFRRDQLEGFFETERHRELVVACYPENFKSKTKARKFLRSLKYQRVIECTGDSATIFEIRSKAERKFPPDEADSQYHHTREIRVMKSLDEIDIHLGTLGPPRKNGTQTYRTMHAVHISKEELLSFLKQDAQRGHLLVHWSKYYWHGSQKADEDTLRRLSEDCKFLSTKFEQDFGMFQVEPTVVSP